MQNASFVAVQQTSEPHVAHTNRHFQLADLPSKAKLLTESRICSLGTII